MRGEVFENVFDALFDDPVQAAEMTARADLTLHICAQVEGWGISRARAAKRLGLTPPHLQELWRGKLPLEELRQIAARLDHTPAA
jgi:predicted XRE-type DNA-binding protein